VEAFAAAELDLCPLVLLALLATTALQQDAVNLLPKVELQ